ncbi:MAG: urease accessory protein [Pseudonocardiales bacterium]|nr:urease accessory protein [Pseudonocardiales bacterium]
MRSRSRAVVEAGGVLRELSSQPPLTLRRLLDPDRDVCALCVIGSAAGPLAGDDLGLEIEVGDGARATLVAAGASIALGRKGSLGDQGVGATMRQDDGATMSTDIRIGSGSSLSGRTGVIIAAEGSRLDVRVRIHLAADATLYWSEVLVLGRSNERSGAVRMRWDVERGGWPLLRQVTDLRDAARRDWPGTIAGARVLATALRVGPDVRARTLALSRTAAVHALAGDAELMTVLAPDAIAARKELELLGGYFGDEPRTSAPDSRRAAACNTGANR